MITSAEFKATVHDYVERQPADRLPAPGELMLMAHSDGMGWRRATMRPPYTWVASRMVRGFILRWKPDRLAIVAPAGGPRQFRVAFAERDGEQADASITDRRLAALVAAAHREWNRPTQAPLRTLFGRPWPITLLCVALLLELGPGLIRLSRGVALASPVVYFVEAALILAAVVMLWRQSRMGYVFALVLSAIQLAYPIVAYLPYLQSQYLGTVAVGLLLSWSYPALIWIVLAYLWRDRIRRQPH